MNSANYFKLGIFVIIGTCIFAVLVVIFGAGKIFQKRVMIETYFEESVQGLDVGSSIKFRGVHIGKVESIKMAANKYKAETRLIMVRASLLTDKFLHSIEDFLEAELINEINKGLRIRLSFQGITGKAYLEMDYLDPQENPFIQINWLPDYPYLPSTPSVMTRLSDSLSNIMRHLEKINLRGITKQFEETLNALHKILETSQLKAISNEAVLLLSEMRTTNQHLQSLLQNNSLIEAFENTNKMIISANRIAENAEKPVEKLLKNLSIASRKLNQASEKINVFSKDLPKSSTQFKRTLRRLDSLLFVQQDDIEKTIDNILLITENLKELTENAKKYPSQFLFGAPPTQSRPGR